MTKIDVDTSPLQAAREWRGIGLVAAALTSGLPVTCAEALETGNTAAFESIDEMIASAVMYGASLGIGRDEAMALLDRTVSHTGAQVELPEPVVGTGVFSSAVRERSARIADRSDAMDVEPLTPMIEPITDAEIAGYVPAAPLGAAIDAFDQPMPPASLDLRMPTVPGGPTPEQAVEASAEIHIDQGFGPEAPWEREGQTGELEAWAAETDDDFGGSSTSAARTRRDSGAWALVGATGRAGLERVIGTDRSDQFAEWAGGVTDRTREMVLHGRERLRKSEHATLIVAIGGGALLIALLVAIGGAVGGGNDTQAGPGPAVRSGATDTAQVDAAASVDAKAKAAAAAKPVPLLPASRIRVSIFNAGSQKGKAQDVAAKLSPLGYRINQVTNAKGDYSNATIIYPKGRAREAKILARRTGITTLQETPGASTDFVVVTR